MAKNELLIERLTYSVIGAFFEVYNELGFGFLEHIYKRALEIELNARGHRVAREVYVRVFYKGQEIGWQKLDFVVDGILVVEVKSTRTLEARATRQIFNYLKATDLQAGLLLHFGPKANVYRANRPSTV
jgi:GxxExxY protein